MTLWVDFNDIDESGRVVALLPDGMRPPASGLNVYLADHEGNRCFGKVATIANDLVYIEPDWETWATPRDRHKVPQGWWIQGGAGLAASEGAIGTFRKPDNAWRNTGDAPVRTDLPRVHQSA
jgi:hypothetical protein